MSNTPIDIDALAQEIRRVDGNHDKGAGALAEALMPFLTAALQSAADTPAPSSPETHVVGRWLPIELADKSVDRVIDFPSLGRKLTNSEDYWVRDADGRTYHATWADDGKRAYWWDFDNESPVDPVEFMPHPLDPRFAATATESAFSPFKAKEE